MGSFRVFILAMQLTQATIMIVACIPLARRKIPPNAWYGFRVRRTLADPALWYEINAHAGRSLIGAGIAIASISLALAFIPVIGERAYAVCCATVSLVAVVAASARSLRYLQSLPG